MNVVLQKLGCMSSNKSNKNNKNNKKQHDKAEPDEKPYVVNTTTSKSSR